MLESRARDTEANAKLSIGSENDQVEKLKDALRRLQSKSYQEEQDSIKKLASYAAEIEALKVLKAKSDMAVQELQLVRK